jgi:predicted permease
MRRFFLRLLHPFTARSIERELAREIESHLLFLQDDFEDKGLTPDDARMAARRTYGGIEQAKELHREARGFPWLDQFLNDVRYGARVLRKSPGFSAVSILTLALGVGATTAIFSAVDATLLHPLPYPQSEQIVNIEDDLRGIGSLDIGMSVPEWWDFQRSGIFEYVSAIGGGSVNLTGSSQPVRIRFLNVAPNYFALLRVKAQFGHTFNPEDRTPGFNEEILLSDALWKQAFGADPRILGKNLRLDNDLYRVIGVMPRGFHDPGRTAEERSIQLWAASGFAAAPAPPPLRKSRFLAPILARIKPGLTLQQAQSRVDALVAALQKQFPEEYPIESAWTVRLVPLKEGVAGSVRRPLILLLGGVGLVLLIGCVNVANLLLARSATRAREMAVRQALGAARRRLVSQLVTEACLLSMAGGVAGLAILLCAEPLLLKIVPDSLPQLNELSINASVFVFALFASLGSGVIFSLAPVLHSRRLDVTHVLKQEGRSFTASGEQARIRRMLVITEFALSLVLMIAAGLLLRSLLDLLNLRLGFNPQNVMTVKLWLPVPNDPTTDIYGTAAQEAPFIREVLRRGRGLPGVEEIALADMAAIPLGHGRNDLNRFRLILEDHPVPASRAPIVNAVMVTPGYFHLMQMPLVRGRLFSDFDNEQVPSVALVNEAFARTYCPNADPVGKRVKLPVQGSPSSFYWSTVIGVVADARTESLGDAPIPQLYLSLYQRRAKDLAIFVRGRLDIAATAVCLRERVQSINPELPVFHPQTLDDVLLDSLSQRRFSMEIVGLFAVTALLLAGLGIYGVISYTVSERTREIGIRLALGAETRSILRMVLHQGLDLAITGTAVGLLCAVVISRLMSGLVNGVRATDAMTFAGLAVLLITVALLASYIPARRAIRVEPVVALRYE